LHLDGGAETLPQHGDAVILDGRTIGWIGTAARHFELGPIATAIIKRSVPVDADLIVQCGDGTPIAASQEVVVSA
jgi:folate-binding Fe-S cluster repair protein YgfZ